MLQAECYFVQTAPLSYEQAKFVTSLLKLADGKVKNFILLAKSEIGVNTAHAERRLQPH